MGRFRGPCRSGGPTHLIFTAGLALRFASLLVRYGGLRVGSTGNEPERSNQRHRNKGSEMSLHASFKL